MPLRTPHAIHATLAALVLLLVLSTSLPAATVSSPDGKIIVTVGVKEKLEPYPAGKRLYYSIAFGGKPILEDSPFRLDFKGMPPVAKNLVIRGEQRRAINETWKPVWGTRKQIANHANQITLSLQETKPPERRLELVIRAYDDGVAFRYVIPEQPGIKDFRLTAERTEFHFGGDQTVWAANYGSFATHQETECLVVVPFFPPRTTGWRGTVVPLA